MARKVQTSLDGQPLRPSKSRCKAPYDYEFLVADPVLGDVSCESLEQAKEYASNVQGLVFRATWYGGQEIYRKLIT